MPIRSAAARKLPVSPISSSNWTRPGPKAASRPHITRSRGSTDAGKAMDFFFRITLENDAAPSFAGTLVPSQHFLAG